MTLMIPPARRPERISLRQLPRERLVSIGKAYEATGYDATFTGEPMEDSMPGKVHEYASRLVWEGNKGDGTSSYSTYGRQYRIHIGGKPDIVGSADKSFLGDPEKHDPENLFLAALSSCHLLSYLALCAKHK